MPREPQTPDISDLDDQPHFPKGYYLSKDPISIGYIHKYSGE